MKKISAIVLIMVMLLSSVPSSSITVSAATLKTPKITSVSAKSDYGNFNSVTIKWKKQKNISGYIIYEKIDNGSYKKIKVIKDENKTSYVSKGIGWAEKCTYKIRTYKSKNGKKTYSAKSKAVYTYSDPMDAPFEYVKSSGKNKIKLKWWQVPHADGYAIYQKSGKKYKRIATINSNETVTYTVKGLKKNKEYTFKVRSFIKRNGEKYYSMATPKSATTNQKHPTIQLNKKIKYYGYTGVFLIGDCNTADEGLIDLTVYGIKNSYEPALCSTEYYDVKTGQQIWFACSQDVADEAASGDGSIKYFVDRLENGSCGAPAKVKYNYPKITLNKKVKYHGYDVIFYQTDGWGGPDERVERLLKKYNLYGAKDGSDIDWGYTEYYDKKTKKPIMYCTNRKIADKKTIGVYDKKDLGEIIHWVGEKSVPVKVKK